MKSVIFSIFLILAGGLTVTAADKPTIGPTAVSAKWSNYGAYLQRVINAVQVQWEKLLFENKIPPSASKTVTVKFIMDSNGKIPRIISVDSTADDLAARACVSAIAGRAPYGAWTEGMKAVLGEQQEMTFTFYYR